MSLARTRSADSAGVDRAAYPFDDKWRPLRAGRMHYVDEGAGEPIVFAHGTPTWSFEWRHLIRALSPEYRTIAPDHLGFGLSERPRSAPYTPEWHAENFIEFVEALDIGPLTLVVHDFGGPIALPLALRRPDLVKRLVVTNSWMWSFVGDRDMEQFKTLVTEVLTRHASAILLDPEWGLPASKRRAPGAGLLLAYEKTGYDATTPGRLPDLLDAWSVRRLKEAGADCIKILLYYAPTDARPINDLKHAWVERIGDECRANDIPFFLEFVGYQDGLDEKGPEYARRKP